MEKIVKELRKNTLLLSHKCKDGNLQSAFSCLDILWVLYSEVMNWDVEKADADDRDIFVISKGQATLALYSVFIQKGLFSLEEIAGEIGEFHSRYCNQVDVTKYKGGIENSAGSLGHGLPYAVGIAMANKIKNIDSITFVLCGDGEFMEGTMWESCLLASSHKLDNLCVIIDDNDSVSAMIDIGSIKRKLEAFDFDVYEVDGHDLNALAKVFKYERRKKPIAIIAKTIRGYGSLTMTENDVWFHKAPNKDELLRLYKEVDEF